MSTTHSYKTLAEFCPRKNDGYSQTDSSGVSLEKKLDALFQYKENGFFIELGGNDGLFQSNTAMFEFLRGWTGILIEPSPSAYELCKMNRPGSLSLNYACVSNDYTEKTVKGDFDGGPMASVNGERLNNKKLIDTTAITLTAILDKYSSGKVIDFLSLDTEGYELNILKGLDLNKYRPRYMLIEIYTRDYNNICEYLEKNKYKLHSNFTNYNHKDNPYWGGDHNDYFFYDETCLV